MTDLKAKAGIVAVRRARQSVSLITKILTGRNIPVHQRGTNAFVASNPKTGEPVSVTIPFIQDTATVGFIAAVNGFIVHEVAHIMLTDFTVTSEAASHGKMIKFYWNTCEDIFIEREIVKTLRGSAPSLESLGEIFFTEFLSEKLERLESDEEATEKDWWHTLAVAYLRALSGQAIFERQVKPYLDRIPTYVERLDGVGERLAKTKSSDDCLELALEIREMLSPPKKEEEEKEGEPEKSPEEDSDETPDDDKDKDDSEEESEESEPGEGDDSEEESEEIEIGDGSESEGDGEGDTSDTDSGTDEDMKEGAGGKTGAGDSEEDGEHEEEDDKSESMDDQDLNVDDMQTYDEQIQDMLEKGAKEGLGGHGWSVYSSDHDIIKTYKPALSKLDTIRVDLMEEEERLHLASLSSQLRRLFVGQKKVYWRGRKTKGFLDQASYARLVNGDADVFTTKESVKSKSSAFLTMVDCSGSMSLGRIPVAMTAAYGVHRAATQIGITNKCIGFSTTSSGGMSYQGCDPDVRGILTSARARGTYDRIDGLWHPIFKNWNEQMSSEVKMRFAAMRQQIRDEDGYCLLENHDGDSLMLAIDDLASREEENKVIIVMSDGSPACCGTTNHALNERLREAIKYAKTKNIQIRGIGIQSDAGHGFYDNWQSISALEQLPQALFGALRSIALPS